MACNDWDIQKQGPPPWMERGKRQGHESRYSVHLIFYIRVKRGVEQNKVENRSEPKIRALGFSIATRFNVVKRTVLSLYAVYEEKHKHVLRTVDYHRASNLCLGSTRSGKLTPLSHPPNAGGVFFFIQSISADSNTSYKYMYTVVIT